MIKLIKLLINFYNIHSILRALYTLLIQLPQSNGSHPTSVSLITPGHSGTALFVFSMLYERVDDVLVLIYSINAMWLFLFACIFSILK